MKLTYKKVQSHITKKNFYRLYYELLKPNDHDLITFFYTQCRNVTSHIEPSNNFSWNRENCWKLNLCHIQILFGSEGEK